MMVNKITLLIANKQNIILISNSLNHVKMVNRITVTLRCCIYVTGFTKTIKIMQEMKSKHKDV